MNFVFKHHVQKQCHIFVRKIEFCKNSNILPFKTYLYIVGSLFAVLPTRNFSERNIKNEDKTAFSGDTDNTFIQFFRYVFVGGFAFVVDYGIMTALVELCRFDPVIAATISFVAGLLVNYSRVRFGYSKIQR